MTTSSLPNVNKDVQKPKPSDTLLERYIADKVSAAFNTFGQKYIASSCNHNDMRVLAEKFEANRIVKFSRGLFPRIVQSDQVGGIQRFLGDRVLIVVISEDVMSIVTESTKVHILEPRDDIYKVKHRSSAIRIASTDGMGERLE